MAGILHSLKGFQDAFNSLGPAPSTSSEPVLPELKQHNNSVYELCRPSGPRVCRPSVEIVFFHGLQFDGTKRGYLTTWLSKDGQECWLPWIFESFPEARILLVSYDSSAKTRDDGGCTDMYITSENLLQDLIDDNAQVGQDGCPVVLVGHSVGGLVIKEVLLKANLGLNLGPKEERRENLFFFLENVKYLFYYSCPHHGTRLANIQTNFLKGQLLERLTTLNKEPARCHEDFRMLRQKFKWKVCSIGEKLPTNLKHLGKQIVVEEASARHDTENYYTVHADHINVCRPESTIDASFLKLQNVVNRVVLAADVHGHKVMGPRDEVVGLDDQIKMVRRKLEKSGQVGLVGLGGIGKTTLAKLVYDEMSDNFEYTCCVREFKGTVTEEASLEDLQAEILKDLYYKGRKVPIPIEWNRLKGKRALIVLDNVKYESHVLVLRESGFSTDSCVLLTSRDQNIPRLKDFKVHVVDLLDDEAAKRLFCSHAFKTATTPEAYKNHVERFIKKCGGWPLVLEVVGKYLYKRKDEALWDGAYNKLSQAKPLAGRMDEDRFWPIFTTIYESLTTDERQMFLDVAICYHDEELQSVKRAWRVYISESVDAAWQNLVDMGLVTTRPVYFGRKIGKAIQMHEVLRDFGRSIACPKGTSVQGHSHVCHNIDANAWPFEQVHYEVKILKIISKRGRYDKTIDTRKFRGLVNLKAIWIDGASLRGSYNWLPDNVQFVTVVPMRMRSRLRLGFGEYWDQWFRAALSQPHPNLRHIEINSERAVFGQLKVPYYLWLDRCWSRGFQYASVHYRGLKHLRISDYQGKTLPDSFGDLQALEHFEIGVGTLEVLPTSLGQLRALKTLHIMLDKLRTIPNSLGQLSALQCLRLWDCFSLTSLPETLGQLKALERLELIGCSKLTLPETLGQLDALQDLKIVSCSRRESPPIVLGKLQALKHLVISDSFQNCELPVTLKRLQALQHLEVDMRRGSLKALQEILRALRQPLQHLTVVSTENPRIVETLGKLDAVKHLNVRIGYKPDDRVDDEDLCCQGLFEIFEAPQSYQPEESTDWYNLADERWASDRMTYMDRIRLVWSLRAFPQAFLSFPG
ncbi:unnamed protein product [Calypogeia fissa]